MTSLIDQRFRQRLRDAPETPVLVSPRATLGPTDIDEAAQRFAATLAAHGIGPGDRVAIVGRGAGFLCLWLATLRRQAAPVLVDIATPLDEQRRIAAVLGARAIAGVNAPVDELTDAPWIVEVPVEVLPLEVPATSRSSPSDPLEPPLEAIKLTSGSTGAPRGILCSGAALLADEAQLTETMGLAKVARRLTTVPLSHSYGLSSLALPALVRATTLVVPDTRPDRQGPFAPLVAARDFETGFFPTVPAWAAAMGRLAQAPAWPTALRLVISAGAPLSADVARRFRQRFGVPVHVFYGSSETGGITFDTLGDAAERGTVGTPVAGVEIEIDGETARVAVRSPAVATGYTPETDLRLAGGRFLTSDLGRIENGELVLEGRADDWILVRGKNVNPREVESVLRDMPGVDDAAVFALPPSTPGGESRVRAVIASHTARPGSAGSAPSDQGAPLGYEAVAAWCRERLADHKIPRSVVVVPELPRNERGKLDRPALARLR